MGLSASCANKEETIERILLEKELFDQAQNRLRSGNFAAAAMSLEMLEARYPLEDLHASSVRAYLCLF